jgi:hypothetical protein
MAKFVIAPHMRLHEWIARDKGYFNREALEYELSDQLMSASGKLHDLGDKDRGLPDFRARTQLQHRLRLPLDYQCCSLGRPRQALPARLLGRAGKDLMPKIIEKGTPMSQVMILVEFEVKPDHRSQFIELMRGHAERSRRDEGCLQFDLMLPRDDATSTSFWSKSGATRRRSMPTRRGRCQVTPTKAGSSAAKSRAARQPISRPAFQQEARRLRRRRKSSSRGNS